MMTLMQVDTTEQRVNDNDYNDADSNDHNDSDDNDDYNDDNSDDHDDVDAGGLVHDRAEGEQRPGHDQRAQERACLSCCVATRGHGEYFCRNKGACYVFFVATRRTGEVFFVTTKRDDECFCARPTCSRWRLQAQREP